MKMPKDAAEAFVSSLQDISGARTPVSRAAAARSSALARRGIRLRTYEVDDATIDDLAQCRAMSGRTNRQLLRQAVAVLRMHLGDGLSPGGLDALGRLSAMTNAHPVEVIDFCVRYAIQEAKKAGRIALD